jgi:prepilin-type N-terminal cleavage/methylation domain-containing protein
LNNRTRFASRRAFTLVEMMVAAAVSLVLILGVVEAFRVIGEAVADGRATLTMSGQVRTAANSLHDDLVGLTVPARPWPSIGSGLGYLEIGEGINNSDFKLADPTSMLGDCDDYIAFTARSREGQFTGRFMNRGIRSNEAEIIWWTEPSVQSLGLQTYTIRRRLLLIRPDLDTGYHGMALGAANAQMKTLQQNFDVSLHIEEDKPKGSQKYSIVFNSLADLTMRHNRVGHVPLPGNFPSLMQSFPSFPAPDLDGNGIADPATRSARRGEDVVISHVISFDIRVFDPAVPVLISRNGDVEEALLPGDPGYEVPAFATNPPRGGFVDLFYGRIDEGNLGTALGPYFSNPPIPQFAGQPKNLSRLQQANYPWATYDTWSLQYESDGINQDLDAFIDEGTNGLDNPDPTLPPNLQNPAVDDVSERETSPPYPFPLRGIQITVRVFDPDSRQVRQITVVKDFTPE